MNTETPNNEKLVELAKAFLSNPSKETHDAFLAEDLKGSAGGGDVITYSEGFFGDGLVKDIAARFPEAAAFAGIPGYAVSTEGGRGETAPVAHIDDPVSVDTTAADAEFAADADGTTAQAGSIDPAVREAVLSFLAHPNEETYNGYFVALAQTGGAGTPDEYSQEAQEKLAAHLTEFYPSLAEEADESLVSADQESTLEKIDAIIIDTSVETETRLGQLNSELFATDELVRGAYCQALGISPNNYESEQQLVDALAEALIALEGPTIGEVRLAATQSLQNNVRIKRELEIKQAQADHVEGRLDRRVRGKISAIMTNRYNFQSRFGTLHTPGAWAASDQLATAISEHFELLQGNEEVTEEIIEAMLAQLETGGAALTAEFEAATRGEAAINYLDRFASFRARPSRSAPAAAEAAPAAEVADEGPAA